MELIWGFDLGSKTLGIAHNQESFAFPYKTLKFAEFDFDDCVAQIIAMFSEEKPQTIVVGYPINMNGTIGERAHMIDAFIEDYLVPKLGSDITVVKSDERLTTKMAGQIMRQANAKAKTKDASWKQKKDEVAAQLILESYLKKI